MMMKYQKGIVPIPIVVALAIAAVIGGYIGFKLGDGTFFSFGVGFGIVLILMPILTPYLAKLKNIIHKGKYEE